MVIVKNFFGLLLVSLLVLLFSSLVLSGVGDFGFLVVDDYKSVSVITVERVVFYNFSQDVFVSCELWSYNFSDCEKVIINSSGEVCVDWARVYYTGSCYDKTILVRKNYSVVKPLGYNIDYFSSEEFSLFGDCCKYYAVSPYREFVGEEVISCKDVLFNVCNPLIQQSSSNFKEFDEFGFIYVLKKTGVEVHRVGGYSYVDVLGVEPSSLEVKN